MKKNVLLSMLLLALSLFAVTNPAMADTATVVADTQTRATTDISLVGEMLIALAGLSMVYRWVKASFF